MKTLTMMCVMTSDTVESDERDQQSTRIVGNSTNVDFQTIDHKDEWSDDEAETPAGVTDTMLTSTDFLEDNECQNILNVAPAEGNRTLSIFRDKYSEELAYPGIFLSQQRPESKAQTTKFFIVIFVFTCCKFVTECCYCIFQKKS